MDSRLTEVKSLPEPIFEMLKKYSSASFDSESIGDYKLYIHQLGKYFGFFRSRAQALYNTEESLHTIAQNFKANSI